jgi:hypothetical protein
MDRIDDESSSVNDAASEDAEGTSSTASDHNVDVADQVTTAADPIEAGAADDDAATRSPRAGEFEKLVRSVARDHAPPDAPATSAAAEVPDHIAEVWGRCLSCGKAVLQ